MLPANPNAAQKAASPAQRRKEVMTVTLSSPAVAVEIVEKFPRFGLVSFAAAPVRVRMHRVGRFAPGRDLVH